VVPRPVRGESGGPTSVKGRPACSEQRQVTHLHIFRECLTCLAEGTVSPNVLCMYVWT
jgi:hypothetical protein